MKNDLTLSTKELDVLSTQLGAQAVIFGHLSKTYNKVTVTRYNKLSVGLGYDKVTSYDLDFVRKDIMEDPIASKLNSLAMAGQLHLSDLTITDEGLAEEADLEDDNLYNYTSPIVTANQEVLANQREFAKLQREGAYTELLFKGLKKHLVNELQDLDKPKYIERIRTNEEGSKELIVALSDWHIGAYVRNIDTGGYDFTIFKDRLNRFLTEVKNTIAKEDITLVHLYHIGDLIEHINMRNVNQAFEAEFSATEQSAKAQRVLVEILQDLSAYADIRFGMVGGNHDRFQGNKADKIYNDSIAYLVLDGIFLIQELGLLPNVEILDNREDIYSFYDEVAGKVIKVCHGDSEGKKVDVKIPRHIKNTPIDYMIMGHIHTSRIVQEDFHRYHIYVGSTMGANNYSQENNLPTTSPSQLMILLENGSDSPTFKPVML